MELALTILSKEGLEIPIRGRKGRRGMVFINLRGLAGAFVNKRPQPPLILAEGEQLCSISLFAG